MLTLRRTNSGNKDFINLIALLDEYLQVKDGDDHSFYAQFNKLDKVKHVIVAYENNKPVGCGAIKEYDGNTMEIKRMFVLPEVRGRKIGSKILIELENWASELHYTKCILETGKRQIEAVRLYKNSGYEIIPNYGQYRDVENSVCFEKRIGEV
ncbi:MAG: GNAT family N-acetyltransferase [Bacteroidetes bacterium]|nr:GNAT family N-acetyltransferase [Bacteroidota bacterium]